MIIDRLRDHAVTSETPLCFIVGPIGSASSPERKLADLVRNMIVQPIVTEHGFEVKRADDDKRPGSISQAVIRDVLKANLVIADMTGFNPNVFYELGIRHTTGLPTIHLIAENVRLPFDNVDQRAIFVDMQDWGSICAAKEHLKAAVAEVKASGFHDSNPVTQARGAEVIAASGDSRDQQLAALQARVDQLEAASSRPTALTVPDGVPPINAQRYRYMSKALENRDFSVPEIKALRASILAGDRALKEAVIAGEFGSYARDQLLADGTL